MNKLIAGFAASLIVLGAQAQAAAPAAHAAPAATSSAAVAAAPAKTEKKPAMNKTVARKKHKKAATHF